MPILLLKLLGISAWIKKGAYALLCGIKRYPLHAALIASLCPRPPAKYAVNGAARNSKFFRNSRTGNFAFEATNIRYILFGQFRVLVPFSVAPSPMLKHISAILPGSCPPKMFRVYAPIVPIPATMGGLMHHAWWFAVNNLTCKTCDRDSPPILVHVWARRAWKGKGPEQAVISRKRDNHIVKECSLPISRSNLADWRSIPPNALVVHITKAGRFYLHGLAAFWDEAYRSISHGAVLSRGGQGRALLTQRFRPDFFNGYLSYIQGSV